MKIAIANDHRGYNLKMKLIKYLSKKGYQIVDIGCNSIASVDYPIYAFELGKTLLEGNADIGICICGSGIGMSIAMNKIAGIRCAKASNVQEAKLSRLDNNANVLALSASYPYYKILDIIDTFLKTPFSNATRHVQRLAMIEEYEQQNKKTKRKPRETQPEVEDTPDEC